MVLQLVALLTENRIEKSHCIRENIDENNNLNWNVSGVAFIETCKWWKETGNLRETEKLKKT